MNTWSTIILAAGKGTRLKSDIPKPLVDINEKKLIEPILENANQLTPGNVFIAIIEATSDVAKLFPDSGEYISIQGKGTGAAVAEILPHIKTSHVLIAQADDSHFYKLSSLEELIASHADPLTVAVAPVSRFMHYSSVISEGASLIAINRDKAAPSPKNVFCGLYAAEVSWLKEKVANLTPNEQDELPLPDIVDAALLEKTPVSVYYLSEGEWSGVNTPEELAAAREHSLQIDN